MSVSPLLLQLGAAPADARSVVRALAGDARVDLGTLPHGALALLLAQAAREHGRRYVVLVPDASVGARLDADLRFFSADQDLEGLGRVLYYPGADTSPFVDVAPDQRAAMDRLSVLFHLSQELPWQVLVAPVSAVIRRVAPRAALAARCLRVSVLDRVDRERLVQLLIEGGYLRAPLCEDAGTFALRGSLLDVYTPHAEQPARIELDDDHVVAIKTFDPEDQRTLESLPMVAIHPVRDTLLGPDELARAREQVSDLCDALNLPTLRRRQLVDDVASGRRFIGVEGFLPAFYERLETLFDYLPADVAHVVIDPIAIAATLDEEYARAARDHNAKVAAKAPVFALDALYLTLDEWRGKVLGRPLSVAHKLAVLGAQAEPAAAAAHAGEHDVHDAAGLELPEFAPSSADQLLRIACEDQSALASELRAGRMRAASDDPLRPLCTRVLAWLDEGLRVLLTARTQVQAERLASLLRSYQLPVQAPKAFEPDLLKALPSGRAEVVVGPLGDGFVLPSLALALVTEEEVFGARQSRKAAPRKAGRDKARAFVADLRELHVGDYVVHVEHGVGVYRGLSLSELPVTRYEALQGQRPKRVEVLVVEYAGGDRLFLPVTRLNQIEKLASKDGTGPKLDKLGGQTFGRTKSRVKASVEQLADELLQLYAARGARERAPYPPPDRHYAEFEAHFQYEETADQARAIDDVMSDLDHARPMDRLVCGDVGFGKTEVALRAAFRVAMSGRQVAVLCPTTVLAQQHLMTFSQRLAEYPLRVEMLSRFVAKKQQSETLARLKQGSCDIVIGTHRILSKDVHFGKLGLLVVDEEQRFGVAHKERIKKLRTEVDVLTLSATPIPRTLQMAIGGLRELSLISTPPVDRRAVRTFITRWDDHVLTEAVTRELARGGQVFFVHNRIEGLYERTAHLQQLLPKVRIAVAHGRVREELLERVMTDFVDGRYDILACTAIVENGLDIPRANTIIIDRADMLGLSQLYQLRGRVGRSRERAYCYLVVPPPAQLTDEARARIEVLERFSQLGAGFQVASLDMELRGAGDLLGGEQSGNLAAVGFDLFVRMLQEAIAEHRGESVTHELEPDLAFDLEYYIPEEYVPDVGLRLSFYKRFAAASDEEGVHELAAELEDRFGPPPPPVLTLRSIMALKPALRALRVLGCDANATRVTLHFSADAPIDRAGLANLVSRSTKYQLTPEGKLICRFDPAPGVDAIDRTRTVLQTLLPLRVQA